jgi:tetratricopeptide (TPR) repeat protein
VIASPARVEALLDLGRVDEATRALGVLLQERPDDFQALCLLALARLQAGRPGDTQEAANRALSVRPEEDWPLRLLALAHLSSGRVLSATRVIDHAVRVSPEEWRCHAVRLRVARARGRLRPEDRRSLQDLLRLAPDEPEALTEAAVVEAMRHHHRAADRYIAAALHIDPDDATALALRARSHLRHRREGSAAAIHARLLAEGRASAEAVEHVVRAVGAAADRAARVVAAVAAVGMVISAATASSGPHAWPRWAEAPIAVVATALPVALVLLALRFRRQAAGQSRRVARALLKQGLGTLIWVCALVPATALTTAGGILLLGGRPHWASWVLFGVGIGVVLFGATMRMLARLVSGDRH